MKQMSTAIYARRTLFGVVPVIAVVLGYGEVFMSQARAGEGIKNVVLVHGGFVDGSGWQGVYDVLKREGYNVAIVQNPTTSLADDVAVTKRTLVTRSTYRSRRPSRRSSRRQRLGLRWRRGKRLTQLVASHVRWCSVNRM